MAKPPRTRLADLAARCGGEGIDKLRALCRELQIVAGKSPFFLDCRACGKELDVSHMTVCRWLHRLCDAGVLTLIRKGEHLKRLASEYIYERANT